MKKQKILAGGLTTCGDEKFSPATDARCSSQRPFDNFLGAGSSLVRSPLQPGSQVCRSGPRPVSERHGAAAHPSKNAGDPRTRVCIASSACMGGCQKLPRINSKGAARSEARRERNCRPPSGDRSASRFCFLVSHSHGRRRARRHDTGTVTLRMHAHSRRRVIRSARSSHTLSQS